MIAQLRNIRGIRPEKYSVIVIAAALDEISLIGLAARSVQESLVVTVREV